MKSAVLICLLAIVLAAGCGGGKAAKQVDELQAKADALETRVKALEKDLLDAQKKAIAQDQEMQKMLERIRTIENYFNRLQAGSSGIR